METKLQKNKTANVGKYSYTYVDIAQIHEYLESIGARYYQYIDRIDSDDYIMTVPIIDEKELTPRRGARVVDATLMGVKNPAQEQGSALTYARRYSLLMAFGLATEDDDAQSLSKKVEPTQEEADSYKLSFGKFKGKTLKEVMEEKSDYVEWLLGNSKDEYVIKCIELATGLTMPSEEEQQEILVLMSKINKLAIETKTDFDEIRDKYQVKSSKDMTPDQLKDCVRWLEEKCI